MQVREWANRWCERHAVTAVLTLFAGLMLAPVIFLILIVFCTLYFGATGAF